MFDPSIDQTLAVLCIAVIGVCILNVIVLLRYVARHSAEWEQS